MEQLENNNMHIMINRIEVTYYLYYTNMKLELLPVYEKAYKTINEL